MEGCTKKEYIPILFVGSWDVFALVTLQIWDVTQKLLTPCTMNFSKTKTYIHFDFTSFYFFYFSKLFSSTTSFPLCELYKFQIFSKKARIDIFVAKTADK